MRSSGEITRQHIGKAASSLVPLRAYIAQVNYTCAETMPVNVFLMLRVLVDEFVSRHLTSRLWSTAHLILAIIASRTRLTLYIYSFEPTLTFSFGPASGS